MNPRAPEFDQASGLLPTAPPARAARAAGVLLLALAGGFALFATLVPLPQVALAPFELVSEQPADAVQAPLAGELVRVAVAEGEQVESGEVLFELTHADLRAAQSQLRQMREQRSAAALRSAASERAHQQLVQIQQTELASAERELGFRRGQVATQKELLARAETLGRNGVVSEVEMLKYRLALAEAEKDRTLGERELDRLRLALQQRESERERARGEEASEARLLAERIAALESELSDSDERLRRVRAPYAAIVLRLPARTPGSVVAQGEVLAELARSDAQLKARLQLPEEAVAQLQPGQPVRLQLDAWPYQRHGSVPATLRWISPAPVESADIRGFIADATLGRTPLTLRAGMRGLARVEIGRSTLAGRALEPLRAARERLR